MSFEELGATLRQERERRGLSVEEVADRLKLMPRVVRAIEQGDFGELPQAAYARGFVKAYGNLLALDTEQLYAGLEAVWPEDSHPLPLPYEPAWEKKGGGQGRLAAIIILMLILAAAGLYWLSRDLDAYLPSGLRSQTEPAISATSEPSSPARGKDAPPATNTTTKQTSPPAAKSPAPSAAVPAPSVTVPSAVPASAPAVPSVAPTPSAAVPASSAAAPTAAPASAPAVPSVAPTPSVAVPTSSSAPTAAPTPSVAAPSPRPPAVPASSAAPAAPAERPRTESAPTATLQAAPAPSSLRENQRNLVIIALAECWVHSTADNTDTRQFSLRKGDTFALTFSKRLVLRLGNAGGVRIRLDGQDLGPPGEVGQVKTLTFPTNP